MVNVALRKESVDRNFYSVRTLTLYLVALRKESVDRNKYTPTKDYIVETSLSARRAWIEIFQLVGGVARRVVVALRKESVDRNQQNVGQNYIAGESLSARRAWIEIINRLLMYNCLSSRSPQGERG